MFLFKYVLSILNFDAFAFGTIHPLKYIENNVINIPNINIGKAKRYILIPEEFIEEGNTERPAGIQPGLSVVVDTIVGSVIKRLARGKSYGVAVVAEGLSEILMQDPNFDARSLRRDQNGNVRYSEIDLSGIMSQRTRDRLLALGVEMELVHHDIGYELRSVAPNAFDREYTLQLGYGAVEFLVRGGSRAMITRRGDQFEAMSFDSLRDATTLMIPARRVSLQSETYQIARDYMERISEVDLREPPRLATLSALTNLSAAEFRREFLATTGAR